MVDGTSPTSEMKKRTFNAIVANKAVVKEILTIASELVCADMRDTKYMQTDVDGQCSLDHYYIYL